MSDSTTQRFQARREQILEQCITVFAQNGFHQTSMRLLCEALQMSPGAFYRYFESKEAVIAAMIEQEQAAGLERFAALSPEVSLGEFVETIFQMAREHYASDDGRRLYDQIYAEAGVNPVLHTALQEFYDFITQQLEAAIRHLQARGEVKSDLRPRDAAIFLLMCFDGLGPRTAFDAHFDWEGSEIRGFIIRSLEAETEGLEK